MFLVQNDFGVSANFGVESCVWKFDIIQESLWILLLLFLCDLSGPKYGNTPKIILVSLAWSVLLFMFLLLKGKKMSIYNVSSFYKLEDSALIKGKLK